MMNRRIIQSFSKRIAQQSFLRCRTHYTPLTAFTSSNNSHQPLSAPVFQHQQNYSSCSGSKENIQSLIDNHKVVVFMKGTPCEPQCGFSKAVVQILSMHGVDFEAHNVLEDHDLRTGIKTFSNWPTIPQVYMKGEFIGGCDIMLQMHQSGDLVEELKSIGIRSALLDA